MQRILRCRRDPCSGARGSRCRGSGGDARAGRVRRRRRGSTAVTAAEARVSAKEKAVTDAKVDLADKSAQFCGASKTYIVALDRYGDVLSQTAPTVGDVRDAGAELKQPQEDALAKAEAAVERNGPVVMCSLLGSVGVVLPFDFGECGISRSCSGIVWPLLILGEAAR